MDLALPTFETWKSTKDRGSQVAEGVHWGLPKTLLLFGQISRGAQIGCVG